MGCGARIVIWWCSSFITQMHFPCCMSHHAFTVHLNQQEGNERNDREKIGLQVSAARRQASSTTGRDLGSSLRFFLSFFSHILWKWPRCGSAFWIDFFRITFGQEYWQRQYRKWSRSRIKSPMVQLPAASTPEWKLWCSMSPVRRWPWWDMEVSRICRRSIHHPPFQVISGCDVSQRWADDHATVECRAAQRTRRLMDTNQSSNAT